MKWWKKLKSKKIEILNTEYFFSTFSRCLRVYTFRKYRCHTQAIFFVSYPLLAHRAYITIILTKIVWSKSSDQTISDFRCRYNSTSLSIQAIETELLKEFGCVVPYITTKRSKICKFVNNEETNKLLKRFSFLASNGQRINCSMPCATMDVKFGVLFNDDKRSDGKSFIRIYMKSYINVQKYVQDFTFLSLLAEIGGYTGLLLGVSMANLTIIVDKIDLLVKKERKAFWAKKWKKPIFYVLYKHKSNDLYNIWTIYFLIHAKMIRLPLLFLFNRRQRIRNIILWVFCIQKGYFIILFVIISYLNDKEVKTSQNKDKNLTVSIFRHQPVW